MLQQGVTMANVVFNPTMATDMWGEPAHETMRVPQPVTTGTEVAARPKVLGWVKMAPDVLRAMTMAAQHAGRTASDVWSEAAREWLLHRSLDADYDVLSNAPARKRGDGVLTDMRGRLWTNIDTMMDDLRQMRPTL